VYAQDNATTALSVLAIGTASTYPMKVITNRNNTAFYIVGYSSSETAMFMFNGLDGIYPWKGNFCMIDNNNITWSWDSAGALWRNGVNVGTNGTIPATLGSYTTYYYDVTMGRFYFIGTDRVSYNTDITSTNTWVTASFNKTLNIPYPRQKNSLFIDNGSLIWVETGVNATQKSIRGAYITNLTPMSTVTGSTKYMRVA
jgi:hypothetical protein